MKLLVGKTASKQLLKIPYKVRVKIESKIEKLPADPFPAGYQKLSGREGYRLRIGDYRVLYALDKKQKVIIVLSAQHRKDAYKKF